MAHRIEFVAIISRRVDPAYTSEQVKRAFLMFQTEDEKDEDHPPGYVSFDTLLEALVEYSEDETLTREKATELLKQLDFSKDGKIDILEYIDLMMK